MTNTHRKVLEIFCKYIQHNDKLLKQMESTYNLPLRYKNTIIWNSIIMSIGSME